jgi:hypothetical protein
VVEEMAMVVKVWLGSIVQRTALRWQQGNRIQKNRDEERLGRGESSSAEEMKASHPFRKDIQCLSRSGGI